MLKRFFARIVAVFRRWFIRRIREVHHVRGMRVLVENTRADIETADVLARLDEALGLIERYHPWRLRHLRRDLSKIWVVRYPCRGAYFPADRTCMTELTFLARRDITAASVASSILHEGVHARIDQMGKRIGSNWHNVDNARIERLCRKAELAFGHSLPPELGAPVIERAAEMLDLADADVAPEIDWAVANARQAVVDLQAAALPDGIKRRLIAQQRAVAGDDQA